MSEPYPAIKNTSTLLEVVDSRNTPLCLMPATTVARQELPHRAVAVLLRDNAGRFLLKQTSGQGWDFSSHAALPAGQANEDLARALLWHDWQQTNRRLVLLGLCRPRPGYSREFSAVFEAQIPAALLVQMAADQNLHLLLDYDELQGIEAQMGELLSPLLRQALQEGWLKPRRQSL